MPEDNRPRVTADKPVRLGQLSVEVGDIGLSSLNDDSGNVVEIVAPEGTLTQQQLEDAVAAHAATFPPDPQEEFRQAVTDAVANEPAGSPIKRLADALLGTTGPGAEPRRQS